MKETMKKEILGISKKLEDDIIDVRQAKIDLCKAMGVKHKVNYTGLAKVKDDSNFRYRGSTLPIIGLYMTHPNGIREYRVSLKGTEHERQTGYSDTVIPEHDLDILELTEI